MIDPKELRIWNWIKYGNDPSLREGLINKWVKVTADIIKWASNPSENCYEPIPLTPEILEKCGFEKSLTTGNYSIFINGYCFGIDKDGNVDLDYMEYQNVTVIKHVHQLQNLIFALTGEELEIKELQHA